MANDSDDGAEPMGMVDAGTVRQGEGGLLSRLAAEHGEVARLLQNIAAARTAEAKQVLFAAMRQRLLAHARAEEATYYAVLRGQDSLAMQVGRLLHEHHEIERLLEQLSTTSVDEPVWETTFDELHHAVQQHVEFEEDEVFERTKELFDTEHRRTVLAEFVKAEAAEKERLRPS